MRWYHMCLLVILLSFGAYTVALGQEGEKMYIPTINGGLATAVSSTPTATPTATNTTVAGAATNTPTPTPTNTTTSDATATHTPTSTPTNTPTATSTSTATATPTLTPTATKATPEITVLNNFSYFVDGNGDLGIVGEVQNTGTANAAFVEMAANVYGVGNDLLDTGTGIVRTRVIRPGHVTCFHIVVDTPPPSNQIDHFTFTYTLVEDIPFITGLDLFDRNDAYFPATQEFVMTGKVRNIGSSIAHDLLVVATIYSAPNGGGLVLRCGGVFTNPPDLAPQQDATFQLVFGIPNSIPIGSSHIEVQLAPTQ